MIWTILESTYLTGFVLLMLVHLFAGSFATTGTVKYRGKLLFRIPGIVGALIMVVFWPIILPVQITQNH